MAKRAAFEVEGAAEMVQALRAAGKDGKKKIREAGKDVGELVTDRSKARARGGAPMQRAAAIRGLKPGATNKGGTIRIVNTAKTPYAMAAFMGVKGRRGWYAAARYEKSKGQQFPKWIGSSWKPGDTDGPYHVNPAIRTSQDDVEDVFIDKITEGMRDLGLDVNNT
jgi:hypothetical protein